MRRLLVLRISALLAAVALCSGVAAVATGHVFNGVLLIGSALVAGTTAIAAIIQARPSKDTILDSLSEIIFRW